MVGLGTSSLRLVAIPNEEFHITPPPPPPRQERGTFWSDFLVGAFGAIVSGLTGGILAPLLVEIVVTSEITLNDYGATGKVDYLNLGASLVGLGAAEAGVIKGVRIAEKTASVAAKVDEALVIAGATSLERNVLNSSLEGIVTEQIGAEVLSKQLVRAGLTEERVAVEIKRLSNILKEEGVKATRFQNEADFVLQETNIFERVVNPLRELGINPEDMFGALRSAGIDVVGIRETGDLVKAFRSSNIAYQNIQEAGINKEIESILERDIEPTAFTRILNAQKLERGVAKANKLISFINPNTAINEAANRIFDPLKKGIEDKVIDPIKKKAVQKFKHIIKQDILRKQRTRNGVYPCFASSGINYLRAVPLGNGEYKCFVVWRKWGYQPVLITPLLPLEFIIQWSESSSPGRIYHDFRRKYGRPKGMVDTSIDNRNAAYQIFNLLGFIPDKYISLGVSLIGNITTAVSVISQDLWGDLARNESKYLAQPIRDKILEIGGGEMGKAIAAQAGGNPSAVKDYFNGKIQEAAEAKQGAFRASGREGKGKVDAVRGIATVLK